MVVKALDFAIYTLHGAGAKSKYGQEVFEPITVLYIQNARANDKNGPFAVGTV